MAIASLTVDLAARLARFESDMGRVVHLVDKAGARIDRTFSGINAGLKASLGGLAAGISLGAVFGEINKAVSDLSRLDDAAERTGASVENLSAIFETARIGGHDLDLAEQGMTRLAKALGQADDESKGAAAALKAVGLSAEALRNMDTGEALLAVAKRLDQYRDGAGKTALAQELLGKSGAALLPLMKDLAEAGALNANATAEQAAQAEQYEKALGALEASKRAFFRTLATDALPAMLAFVQALNDARSASAELGAEKGADTWAANAAIGFAKLVDIADGVVRAFKVVGISIAAVGKDIETALRIVEAAGPLGAKLPFGGAQEVRRLVAERNAFVAEANRDMLGVLAAPSFSQRLDERMSVAANVVLPADRRKPAVPFVPRPAGGGRGRGEDLETRRSADLARLTKQAEAELEQLARAQEAYADAVRGIVGPLEEQAASLEAQALAYGQTESQVQRFIAAQIEEAAVIAELNGALPEHVNLLERTAEARRRIAEASEGLEVKRFVGAGETERLTATREEMQRMAAALERGDITERQWIEGAQARLNLVGQSATRARSAAEELGTVFESAFESAIAGGQSLREVLSSLEQDIMKIVTRKLVTEPLAESITGLFSGKSGGGLLSDVFGWFKDLLPSFAVGTPYVPRDTLAFVHQGERIVPAAQNASGWGGNVIVNLSTPGPVTRDTQAQLMQAAGVGVRRALARNG